VNDFLLVFRGADGEGDRSEYRFSDSHGEPRIDGRLVVDGGTYTIRGVDWLVKKDDESTDMPRFICTLVVEPAANK
jgi:hypothetical protein